MSSSKFKVIVVGGGPVGLVAALYLEQAGIDFAVLEQRSDIIMHAGASLGLNPQGRRVLGRFDLCAAIDAVSTPLLRINFIDHHGLEIAKELRFGQDTSRLITRHQLTSLLYNKLDSHSKAKVIAGKKVTGIICRPDGVQVTCADGTSHIGSIVIGADGAHSKVRDIMRSLALEAGSPDINPEKPFLTTFQAMWLQCPHDSRLIPGMVCETRGRDATIQAFTAHEYVLVGIYTRLRQPTRERKQFTAIDQQAFVETWGGLLLTDSKITLHEAYSSRLDGGMVSLEEGVLDYWSWDGQIVLVGDAAHKLTPSTGEGYNHGIFDIAALVDALQGITRPNSGDAPPTKEQLGMAFEVYQKSRFESVKAACDRAGRATTSATKAPRQINKL